MLECSGQSDSMRARRTLEVQDGVPGKQRGGTRGPPLVLLVRTMNDRGGPKHGSSFRNVTEYSISAATE